MSIKFACFRDYKQPFVNTLGRKLMAAMPQYPFERLSEDAKRILVHGRQEAEELQSLRNRGH
jgi:hypothetical protein